MDNLIISQGSTTTLNPQLAALQRPVWVPQKRVALFIEGANLLHGARSMGIDVDF